MMKIDMITGEILDSSIQLHRRLGPGLFESVYRVLLAEELERRGMLVVQEWHARFVWEGRVFKRGFVVDLLVNEDVVVELKSIEKLAPWGSTGS